MSCTIVVGGQYGSEGKGKIVALTVSRLRAPWVVRCGGPNSGHTIHVGSQEVALRQVPAGAAHPEALLLLSPSSAVDPDLLVREADALALPRERLVVDPRAVLLTDADRDEERDGVTRIASTASGTGAGLIRRMRRDGAVALAGGSELLRDRFRVEPTAPLVHQHLAAGGDVVVEGTQGFGLSLFHGPHYPYVTARDTTASGFAAEVGLAPSHVDRVLMVVRTFPIRVGGNSGPLRDEISWEEVQKLSSAPTVLPEYTTVTKRLRRVGLFDLALVKLACTYNRPTSLAVMGLDRIDYANTSVGSRSALTERAKAFLEMIESQTGVPIEWIGTGFHTDDALYTQQPGQILHAADTN